MDIKSETARVEEFVSRGNYHAAINIAISALNECRRTGDQTGVDHFLEVIAGIAQTMKNEFGSKG